MAKGKRPTMDNRGAADERACIKRKALQMQHAYESVPCTPANRPKYRCMALAMETLVDWIDRRSKRFRARKGGL